jgi:hypothetical protein
MQEFYSMATPKRSATNRLKFKVVRDGCNFYGVFKTKKYQRRSKCPRATII